MAHRINLGGKPSPRQPDKQPFDFPVVAKVASLFGIPLAMVVDLALVLLWR